jgi:hypothetical protein
VLAVVIALVWIAIRFLRKRKRRRSLVAEIQI